MGRVPRHRFVPADEQAGSYSDYPLPIGFGQTISQPYIVAFMTEAIEVARRAQGARDRHGLGLPGRRARRAGRARSTPSRSSSRSPNARAPCSHELGYRNVHVRAGNGYLGWPEAAPFDRIIVTAAPDEVPPALVEQLKMDGLMAVPVGVGEQMLQVTPPHARRADR